jgi:hypothetical protein
MRPRGLSSGVVSYLSGDIMNNQEAYYENIVTTNFIVSIFFFC